MIVEPFDYRVPATVAEALQIAGDRSGSDARTRFLAGGQALIPALRRCECAVDCLIDIGRIEALRRIEPDGRALRVGSAVTLAGLLDSPLVEKHFPVLVQAAASISDPMTRNRATVGGAALNGDPAADWLCLFKLLDAQLEVQSRAGITTRFDAAAAEIPWVLNPGDLLTHVLLPWPPAGSTASYLKIRHPSSGYALAGVGVMAIPGAAGDVGGVRLAATGTLERPQRLREAEQVLRHVEPDAGALPAALAQAIEHLPYRTEEPYGSDYGRQLTFTLILRAWARLSVRPPSGNVPPSR